MAIGSDGLGMVFAPIQGGWRENQDVLVMGGMADMIEDFGIPPFKCFSNLMPFTSFQLEPET